MRQSSLEGDVQLRLENPSGCEEEQCQDIFPAGDVPRASYERPQSLITPCLYLLVFQELLPLSFVRYFSILTWAKVNHCYFSKYKFAVFPQSSPTFMQNLSGRV